MHGITITRDNATKVIALAKTLQDKIALVDNKIDKVNVANNLTTTEADFVLDARQGKALQDQLTSLNGSLIHYVIGECDIECKTYDNTVKAYVGGKTVDFLSNFKNNSTVVPLEGSTGGYSNGVVTVSIHDGNWIRVQSNVSTVAHVRCLMLY